MPSALPPLRLLVIAGSREAGQPLCDLLSAGSLGLECVLFDRVEDAVGDPSALGADLLLLDLSRQPDGIATLRESRRRLPEIPVVVLTGRDEPLGHEALKAGARDFVVKEGADAHQLARSVRYAYALHRADRQREAALDAAEASGKLYRALFESAPGAYLVLAPVTHRIITASDAYLALTGTKREDLIGRRMFEIFPDAPDDPLADGVQNLRASLQRVEVFGQTDVMGVQRYPIRKPDGGFEDRYWTPLNAPVRAEDGSLICIIHRVNDVTEYLEARDAEGSGAEARATLEARQALMEFEVVLRSRELQQANRRLADSESLLRQAGRIARFGAWRVEVPEMLISWSTELYRIHDMGGGETLSLDEGIAFYAPEHQAVIREDFARCVRDGTPFDVELQLITQKGRRIWVRTTGEAVRDDGGAVIRVEGALQDITERVMEREAAARTERQLAATLESISDAFYTLDHQWRFTYVNSGGERILNAKRSELLGRRLWEVLPEVIGTTFMREYEKVVRTRVSSTVVEYYAPLEKWLEARAYPSPEGLTIYVRDVTVQRQSESQLRRQAELLDQTKDAILVRDLDDRIRFWNRGAERLYGWTRDEAMGRSVTELLYCDHAALRTATNAVLDQGEWNGELIQVTRDGRRLTVEGRWTLLRDAEGRAEAVLAVNTDVTERKKIEQQSMRAQRLQSIGTLAGGIAHDLNNVLAPIMLSVELLRLSIRDPEALETLQLIGDTARRGSQLVNQVLTFARGASGERIEVDPAHLVAGIRKIARDTFPKNISVEVDSEEGSWSVSGDPTQLQQVLVNLCVNARDAMPDGGTISITTSNVMLDAAAAARDSGARPGPHVMIEVADEGEGIPQEQLDHIFDPFFTTKEVGKGTGLGLATSLAIVTSHGGFFRVQSKVGVGTRMRVFLPAHEAPLAQAPAPPRIELPRGHGETILIVDDESSIRHVTSKALEKFGYRTIVAADGAEAVSLYSRHHENIDAVLTDMMMPVMDGLATIHALRRIDPHARIIAASGITHDGRVPAAADAGVEHFLPKPYTTESLLMVLREVFDTERAAAEGGRLHG